MIFKQVEYGKVTEINILVLTILFYLFRTTIPFLKFPFLILYLGLIIYTIIYRNRQISKKLLVFFQKFYLSIVLVLILILSFLFSTKLYLTIFIDSINSIVLATLFLLMTLYLKSKDDLNAFIKIMIRFIIPFSLLISIILLCSFLNIDTDNIGYSSKKIVALNSIIGPLSSDYNFSLIPVFFGFIGVLYNLIETKYFLKKGIYNIILVIFSITIFASGSRRGLIVFFVIIIILILMHFYALITKDSAIKKIGSNSLGFLISIILLAFFSYYFTFHASYYFKKKTIELIASKNIIPTKVKFTSVVYKLSTIIFKDDTFSEIYDRIWFNGFDKALDPDSGWGTRIHKSIFPLSGKNVDIVHRDAVGYLLDSTDIANTLDGNAYSYTLIGNEKVMKGDTLTASVYCYVSKNFNGSWVRIFSEGPIFGNITDENSSSFLNEETKNKKTNLFMNGDFNDSTLYWIPYADSTTHEIIKTPFGNGIRVTRTNGDGGYFSLMYKGSPIVYYANHTYQLRFKFKVQKGDKLPFSVGWWVNDANQGFVSHSLPLNIRNINDGWYEATCSYKFKETHLNLATFLNSLHDNSIVDIATVEMVDLDRDDSLPPFYGQFSDMDLRKKGVWQKLVLKAKCETGQIPVFLCFSKNGVKDFSSLEGYVIFAYPQYKIENSKVSSSSPLESSNIIDSKLFLPGAHAQYYQNSLFINRPFNHQQVVENSTVAYKYQASLLSFSIPKLSIKFLKRIDSDPFRNWISKLISEDTTYYGYKNELFIDTISNKFIGDRIMRWQFAGKIFIKEYNWKQKIFGGGFNFLNWFGYRFLKDKTASDYPHNPFLSILLYSGIFGLLIYLVFFYQVIYYYVKYFKEYPIISIFFIITFFFSFFSAGSPFDPPVMGFFVILPFFIHHVHKNQEQVKSIQNNK